MSTALRIRELENLIFRKQRQLRVLENKINEMREKLGFN